jgi:hypothetical protein
MENVIKTVVTHILGKEYPLFDDVEVIKEKSPRYIIYLTIDFMPYLMNYIEIWGDIQKLIKNKLRMIGIKNEISVHIIFSE